MTDLPAPLTDASVDVDGIAGFILDTVRLAQSELTALATGEEFKAAVLLWAKAWQQKPAASLPDDDRVLASFAGLGRDLKAWRRVREMALRGFIKCSDGRLYHPVLAEDAKRAAKNRQQKRDAAGRRWGRDPDGTPPDRPNGHAPEHADASAEHTRAHSACSPDAMPVQSSTNPIQEDFKKTNLGFGSGGSASPRPGKIGGPIGIDWQAIVTRMQRHGFTLDQAWELVIGLGERTDLARRMQGAMRRAEERGRVAYPALVSIASEARAA